MGISSLKYDQRLFFFIPSPLRGSRTQKNILADHFWVLYSLEPDQIVAGIPDSLAQYGPNVA